MCLKVFWNFECWLFTLGDYFIKYSGEEYSTGLLMLEEREISTEKHWKPRKDEYYSCRLSGFYMEDFEGFFDKIVDYIEFVCFKRATTSRWYVSISTFLLLGGGS